MKILLIALLMCSGCTMYTIEKHNPDGSVTIVKVRSTRDLEQPVIHYAREGQDAVFDFQASGVDNNSDMFMPMMMQMMQMMMDMSQPAQ